MSAEPHRAGRPLRVLFHAHAFPRHEDDIAGSFLLRLARALADVEVDVGVLAPAAPGLPPVESIGGVTVRRFRYAPRRYETLAYTGQMAEEARGSWAGRAALAGLLAAGATAARAEVRRWNPDVVHAHWWFPGGLSAAAPGVLGTRPLVVTMHGSDVRLARQVRPAHALFAAVARRASTVTAVSSWLCAQAASMAPGLACRVLPMPVDTDRFTVPAPGAPPRRGLLFVGRLTPQKGLGLLLDALARTRTDASLTVIGSGSDAAALRERADALGLGARIQWLGATSHGGLAPWYGGAEALVVPSTDEGLGLVAVEALLCSTPVIALRSGGLVDVVRDGQTGLLVPPNDPDALAAAIDRLASDPALAARLGDAGRRFVFDRFAPAAVARAYRAIYDEVLGGSAMRGEARDGFT